MSTAAGSLPILLRTIKHCPASKKRASRTTPSASDGRARSESSPSKRLRAAASNATNQLLSGMFSLGQVPLADSASLKVDCFGAAKYMDRVVAVGPDAAGPRKMIIAGLTDIPKVPDNFWETSWAILNSALSCILESGASPDYSFQELSRLCETLCYYKLADKLHRRIRFLMKEHVHRLATSLHRALDADPSSASVLSVVLAHWELFAKRVRIARNVMIYMDRSYALKTPDVHTIWDLGLQLFRDTVLPMDTDSMDIRNRYFAAILDLIDLDRDSLMVNQDDIKSALTMVKTLGLYEQALQPALIDRAKRYYREESTRRLAVGTACEAGELNAFLRASEQRLLAELDRVNGLDGSTKGYIPVETWKELRQVIRHSLVGWRIQTLLANEVVTSGPTAEWKGLKHIWESGGDDVHEENLARLWRICLFWSQQSSLGQSLLRTAFFETIKDMVRRIATNPNRDPEMVLDLLALKQRSDRVLACAFRSTNRDTRLDPLPKIEPTKSRVRARTSRQDGAAVQSKADGIIELPGDIDDTFSHALTEAFEGGINVRRNRPAELVAKYIDARLRSGSREVDGDTTVLESRLDQALMLFRFIQGKDVFEAFYKRDLARRLLTHRSASVDAERTMLSKLRVECGAAFTTRLEGMFKDVQVSEDVMRGFRESRWGDDRDGMTHDESKGSAALECELGVVVLTQGYWPMYPLVGIVLPGWLEEQQSRFARYYLGKHQGRKLSWQPSLGQCVIRAKFTQGIKELQLSVLQGVVILLFNGEKGVGALGYEEIAAATGMPTDELKRTLQSLACGKVRILSKHPKGRDVAETDRFSVNEAFASPFYRVKIPTLQAQQEREREDASTRSQVFQDRQHLVDAAIVRVMKTRKEIAHRDLVTAVFEQLKFPVDASDLKKRIESLMEREYMERDEKQPDVYRYLA